MSEYIDIIREIVERELSGFKTDLAKAKERIFNIVKSFIGWFPLYSSMMYSTTVAIIPELILREKTTAATFLSKERRIPVILFDLINALNLDDRSIIIYTFHEIYHNLLGHTEWMIPPELEKYNAVKKLAHWIADAQVNDALDKEWRIKLGDIYHPRAIIPKITPMGITYVEKTVTCVHPDTVVRWVEKIYQRAKKLVEERKLNIDVDKIKSFTRWIPEKKGELALANTDPMEIVLQILAVLKNLYRAMGVKEEELPQKINEFIEEEHKKTLKEIFKERGEEKLIGGEHKLSPEVLEKILEEAMKKEMEKFEQWRRQLLDRIIKEIEKRFGRKLTEDELRKIEELFNQVLGNYVTKLVYDQFSPIVPPLEEKPVSSWRRDVVDKLREFHKSAGFGQWYYDAVSLPKRHRKLMKWIEYVRSMFGILATEVKYVWWRPHRRYMEFYEEYGIVIPYPRRERTFNYVWVIIDTSGSVVTDPPILRFVLERLLELCFEFNLTLYVIMFASEAVGPIELSVPKLESLIRSREKIKVITGGTEVRYAFYRLLGKTKPTSEEKERFKELGILEGITLETAPGPVILLTDGVIFDKNWEEVIKMAREVKYRANWAYAMYTHEALPDEWNWDQQYVSATELYRDAYTYLKR